MKKTIAILMALVTLFCATGALACGYWIDGTSLWLVAGGGELYLMNDGDFSFERTMANYHFPTSVIQDVTDLCEWYQGTPVGRLGITSNKGSNLRSIPTVEGTLYMDGRNNLSYQHSTIIRKLHANTTVHVYFSIWDVNGTEWYYAVCADGMTGFLAASRIMLV